MKVLREGRWRSAVIRRRHKDGTFKVTYRDTTSETHVPITRMAIEKRSDSVDGDSAKDLQQLQQQPAEAPKGDSSDAAQIDDDQIFGETATAAAYNQESNDPYVEYLSDQIRANSGTFQQSDEFVVGADVDLNSWIDNDDDEDISMMKERAKAASHHVNSYSAAATRGAANQSRKPRKVKAPTGSGHGEYDEIGGEDAAEAGDDDDDEDAAAAAAAAAGGVIEFIAEFDEPPLGLTLSTVGAQRGLQGPTANQPIVTRTVPGGKADSLNVQVGDILSKIDYRPVFDYQVAMQILSTCAYPLCLHFKRGEEKSFLQQSGEMVLQGSKVF